MSLKRCLENVLRAMNHECNFPTLPNPRFNKHQNKSDNLNDVNDANNANDADES